MEILVEMREMWKRFWALCVALVATQACTQSTNWEMSMNAATEAYQQARYTKAEKFLLAALEEAENFGPEDSRFATSLNNLAEVYRAQGRYAEAEPLSRRALAIDEKALGLEHPDVGQSLNNLAGLYHSQGRYAEAEPFYSRALAIAEKTHGPEHPDVARPQQPGGALPRPGPRPRGRATPSACPRDSGEGPGTRAPGRGHEPRQPGGGSIMTTAITRRPSHSISVPSR